VISVFNVTDRAGHDRLPTARMARRNARLAKLPLFVLVSLLSIVPTREFIAWRRAVKQGQIPVVSSERWRTLHSILHLELVGVA
jgi:uncharacterized membrane protein